MQVTLTRVFRSDKDKNGNALVSKAGKPYTKLAIKTQEHGDKWLSGFGNRGNEGWKDGDKVEIEVEQKGEYLNFKMIRPEDEAMVLLKGRVYSLEQELIQLRKRLVELKVLPEPGSMVAGTNIPYPENNDGVPFENDVSADDIPWN